jgi:hypothetical protein
MKYGSRVQAILITSILLNIIPEEDGGVGSAI